MTKQVLFVPGTCHDRSTISVVFSMRAKRPSLSRVASCVSMKAAGARLLARAQEEGVARTDIDGADLFALVAALAWLGDQPALASRADHLFGVIAGSLLVDQVGGGAKAKARRTKG